METSRWSRDVAGKIWAYTIPTVPWDGIGIGMGFPGGKRKGGFNIYHGIKFHTSHEEHPQTRDS